MIKFLTIVGFLAGLGFNIAHADTKTLPEPREVSMQSEYKPHLGISYGAVMPEGSFENTDIFGIDIGFQPFIPFGLGLEYTFTNIEAEGGGDFDRNDLLAKMTYNFGGDMTLLKYSYVGLGLGASFIDSDTLFVGAPLIGFDIPLSERMKHLSLGAAAKYSFYEGTSQPDAFSLTAALKYWF